jgi:uncharacterized membrane protein
MAVVGQTPIASYSVANNLTFADLRAALAAGWRDFTRYPKYGIFFAAFYAIGGAALVYGLVKLGEGMWSLPVIAGFPIVAPFAAVGLYEVSRRRQLGLPVNWRSILWALRGRGDDQVMMVAGIVFVAFSFWMILAHGIFAIFMAESGIGSETMDLMTSLSAIAMLVVGSVVGALFAFALYAITVISLPMLCDKDVDFITAMIVSMGVIRSNKAVMVGWAAIIAVTLFLAMLPAFLGLFVVLPVLGHATWHLYCRAVVGAASLQHAGDSG